MSIQLKNVKKYLYEGLEIFHEGFTDLKNNYEGYVVENIKSACEYLFNKHRTLYNNFELLDDSDIKDLYGYRKLFKDYANFVQSNYDFVKGFDGMTWVDHKYFSICFLKSVILALEGILEFQKKYCFAYGYDEFIKDYDKWLGKVSEWMNHLERRENYYPHFE